MAQLGLAAPNFRNSGSQVSIAAPAIAPLREPMPPNTTYATTRIELFRMKFSGVNDWIWLAKKTPATPDVEAPMANAASLTFVVLTPLA